MGQKIQEAESQSFEELKIEKKTSPDSKDKQPHSETRDIEFLLEIPLQVTVELGRTKMLIKDLLQISQGSVIELDKLAGEPMELYVNNKLIARGEVVVVNEKFGIRLTDIVSPSERLKQLK